jgi:small ligand-binding sensory domain FIST
LDGEVRRFGDGLSTGPDLLAAADDATAQALAGLGGQRPDLVCVFATGEAPAVLDAVSERVAARSSASSLVGCSAGGVIGAGRGVEGVTAVAVWAAVLPGVRLRTFHLEVMTGGPSAAVVGLPTPDDGDVALLLADPWSFPADGFVAQANRALPGLPVVGGLAGGPGGAGSTRLYLDGRSVLRGAVGVLLSGSHAQPVVSQGCRAVGPAMTVTEAAGNVVRGLAGEPALRKIEQVLADLPPQDQALATAGLHLGLAADEYADDSDYLVRSVLGAERDSGGVVIGDLVEVGRTVRLQVRDAGAADADLRASLVRHRARSAPVGGALLFSCNGRGAGLFGTGGADHDVRLVREALVGQGVAGFFAGGELGPVAGRNHLHGFTASLLAFPA